MARQPAVRRHVSEEEFETACETWDRKIQTFAGNRIPFLDYDDKVQEARMILYNCLQLFEEGFMSKKNGAGKGLKTIFHTYFHSALSNQAGNLTARRLMHNCELAKIVPVFRKGGEPKLKSTGIQETKCVESPSNLTYLGEMDVNLEESSRSHLAEHRALSIPFDPSLAFEVESWGFVGDEVVYMLGRAIHQITLEETAALFGVTVGSLERAQETANAKILILATEERNDD